MRHDTTRIPTIEALESRRLMSTSVFLGGQCLPPAPTPTPTPTIPPTPNPNPIPTPTPGHGGGHDDDDNDQGDDDDNPSPTPDPRPAPDPIDMVVPQLAGNWTGTHATPDNTGSGTLSLGIRAPEDDDLLASLDFTGPRRIRWTGQLLYNTSTGHLTMYYLSSKLVAKLDAVLVTTNGTTTLQGTIEYHTPDDFYTATFSLHHRL
jgi:hypothetical protein